MSTETASGTVSQTEVERLLAQVGGIDPESGDAAPVSASARLDSDLLPRHEFPKLSFFSNGELRKLRVRHESFINSLAGRLSIHLGLEVGMQLTKLETMSFEKFTDALANPTHITLLKLEPLNGTCLLDISAQLGLCIVDRELGGSGVNMEDPRPLGQMETRLLGRSIDMIVNEWCNMWSDVLSLRPAVLSHEQNGRFLQTCPAETTMLVLGITARIGEISNQQIQIALPHFTLEPLIGQLKTVAETKAKPAASVSAERLKWKPIYNEIKIQVSAELPEMEMTAREISQLKPGDIIPFGPDSANQVRICLGSTPRFVGALGNSNGGWAVKISEAFKS